MGRLYQSVWRPTAIVAPSQPLSGRRAAAASLIAPELPNVALC
jgi:hypothetical protein